MYQGLREGSSVETLQTVCMIFNMKGFERDSASMLTAELCQYNHQENIGFSRPGLSKVWSKHCTRCATRTLKSIRKIPARYRGHVEMTTPSETSGVDRQELVRWSVAYQKDLFALLQSIFTIAAILAGGLWFWFQGQPLTKANTTLSVEDRRLTGTDWTLLTITIKFENVGLRTIKLTQGDFRVAEVVPVPESISKQLPSERIAGTAPHWKDLKMLQIDDKAENLPVFLNAGETEHVLAEILVPASWKTVRIYARVSSAKDENYWSMTALHDVQPVKVGEEDETAQAASTIIRRSAASVLGRKSGARPARATGK
ncbi:hypothetical protein [Paraburkholderia fynbosensis]|nr:hypothetical protein [Paraburkholderia fynbosensis]